MSAAEIARALRGHRTGDGYLCRCPVHSHGQGKGDRRPSLFVTDGETRLLVTCFAGCDPHDIIAELRRVGLLENGDANLRVHRPRQVQAVSLPVEPDPEALVVWHRATSITGTLAEKYLTEHRGFTGPFPPTLRFLDTYHLHGLPAMVAAVSQPDRKVIAVQLTFLDPTGAKAKVAVPRVTVGKLGTGAVRLAAADTELGLAEGTETALAAMELSGVPCWATLGSQRLDKIAIPSSITEIHVFADNDQAGNLAAEKAADHYTRAGRKVLLRYPPSSYEDWNDALLSRGAAA
ncbi:MAG TPA: toprim domain-containing protein [Hyphomicrobiaceae bacterium]|nr:toprim domain-containing protein [Hyphomicrobiaceae bacterium]